jgi:hypothetical protein
MGRGAASHKMAFSVGVAGASLPTTSLRKDFHKPGARASGFFFAAAGATD